MNDNGKFSANELKPQTEFEKKLDNFWYYNKWKVIAGIFILFVLIVCLIQCASREKTDVGLLYGGAFSASNEKTQNMRDALSAIEPDSVGKNGVKLSVLEIYSDEYVIANQNKVNATTNSRNYDNFCNLITTGEYSLLLIDSWIYEDIKKSVGFRAINDIMGEGTFSAEMYDSCAVKFKSTAYYNANIGSFGELDDDVLLCLCIYSPYKSTLSCGGKDSDRDYDNSIELLKAILNY